MLAGLNFWEAYQEAKKGNVIVESEHSINSVFYMMILVPIAEAYITVKITGDYLCEGEEGKGFYITGIERHVNMSDLERTYAAYSLEEFKEMARKGLS